MPSDPLGGPFPSSRIESNRPDRQRLSTGRRPGESMEITKIRIFPVRDNRLLAYVSITFDDCFVVRDLKIIEGDKGLFVAMPARRRRDGTYRDIAHPLNTETREAMEKKILAAYDRVRKAPSKQALQEAEEYEENGDETKEDDRNETRNDRLAESGD